MSTRGLHVANSSGAEAGRSTMNRSDNRQPGQPEQRGGKRRRRWLWMTVAVAAATALAAMYIYEKSLEDDLEAMLRGALQQFEAESGVPNAPEADGPGPSESAERG